MAVFKQGTNFIMDVTFPGENSEDIEKVEFLFKQTNSKAAPAIKTALYPGTEVTLDGDTFYIPWTAEETYEFNVGTFYLDTRIWYSGSENNPATAIAKLDMGATLFREGEVVS